MDFAWQDVPAPIRMKLVQGGTGRLHLSEMANEALGLLPEAGPREQALLFSLACDMLVAIWEQTYLDPSAAALLLRIHDQKAFLDARLAGLVKFCSRQAEPDAATAAMLDPSRAASAEGFERQLTRAFRAGGNSFHVLRMAVSHAFQENRPDWLMDLLRRDEALPDPLKLGLMADALFASGRWDEAAHHYARAQAALPLTVWEIRRAEATYRAGNQDQAIAGWSAAHKARPWQVNTLLRLTDVLAGRDQPGAFPDGQGAVLLYTWNKAHDIDETLASLAETELEAHNGSARIVVLDNGSTDAVPQVLETWKARFGGRMHVITLPVNVGAPAARNWLLSLPEVRQADWAVFLDDDIALPKDWLRHLWNALRAFPQAGVASGHAVDYHAPMSQQWTDMHIVPLPGNDEPGGAVFRDRFKFTAPHEQAWDFGDFSFMRPCVTAIGCCHMFSRAAMDEGGTFDVRFSPSQSDDVDHDMRRALAGHLPVYNGHLTVRHKRMTGYHTSRNQRGWASAVGNWYKLQASYTQEEVRQIEALDQRTMWDDILRRLAQLDGA